MGRRTSLRASFQALGMAASMMAAMLVGAMAVLLACDGSGNESRELAPSVAAQPPNVVLIVVDTLRRDRVGVYGAARATTPEIDAFAKDAVLFERAYTTAPWTQPAVASILTGWHPSRHGLLRIGRLPDALDTLPERLKARGYATAAVVSHILLGRHFNFDQGIDDFKVAAALPPHESISGARVSDRAIEALERFAEGDAPFFLLAHYFDPHYQYLAHDGIDFAAERAAGIEGGESIEVLRGLMKAGGAEAIDFVRDLYDEEVRFTDLSIGRLLGALQRLDQYDDSLIVLVADHGEEFLERGWLGHTRTLYDELVRVPLIVRWPGGDAAGSRVEQPVSLVAIAGTVLEVAGVQREEGVASLRRAPGGPVFFEVDFVGDDEANAAKETHKKGVVSDGFKLIVDDASGAAELYDLMRDPAETRDVSTALPARVAALHEMLRAHLAAESARRLDAERVEHSAAEREQLRALGYIEP
jgi:arylsulfatase A-like enzyme